MRRRDFLLAAVAMLLKPTAAQSNEQRLALVIGNASYRQYLLQNPVRDASAMRAAQTH